jgi:hypothetical protein
MEGGVYLDINVDSARTFVDKIVTPTTSCCKLIDIVEVPVATKKQIYTVSSALASPADKSKKVREEGIENTVRMNR